MKDKKELHYMGLSVLSLPCGVIIYFAVAFTLLGLSEGFFIKSGVVETGVMKFMNKKTYKILGIVVFAVFAVISLIAMAAFTSINFKILLLLFFIAVILLGISVMFFIKAGIIPTWTKYVVYGYYIFVLLVFILALFGGLGRVLWGT